MHASATKGRCYLLVFEGGSSFMVHLRDGEEVVIGRADGADIQLRDRSISRVHAKVSCAGAVVAVTDLASQNGTRVNGDRVTGTRPLSSGDVISIGGATLVLCQFAQGPVRRPPLDAAGFRSRLIEEVERSLRYGRPLNVVAIELGEVVNADGEALAALVERSIRLSDVYGLPGNNQVLVLLTETPDAEAFVPVERLLERLSRLAPRARAGLASYPADGCQADALLSSARAASRIATVGKVVCGAEAATGLRVRDEVLIVTDALMNHLVALLERLAAGDAPILLQGERGVGKRLLASAVHDWSARRSGPLVCVSGGAVGPGDFSPGVEGNLYAAAAGGTLVIDDAEELSDEAQLALLDLLGGASAPARASAPRIIACTTEDSRAPAAGRARAPALWHRLVCASVVVPPLRERARDLVVLAPIFLREACFSRGRSAKTLTGPALQALGAYSWPGNVAELKALMEELAAVDGEPQVRVHALPEKVRRELATVLAEDAAPFLQTLPPAAALDQTMCAMPVMT